jgi:hypothetical protein
MDSRNSIIRSCDFNIIKEYRREIERRLKIILLIKITVACAASHLIEDAQEAYGCELVLIFSITPSAFMYTTSTTSISDQRSTAICLIHTPG